jgi:hypothetical protein
MFVISLQASQQCVKVKHQQTFENIIVHLMVAGYLSRG